MLERVCHADKTLEASAAPKITNDFGRLYDIAWYGTGYTIPCMALQPTFEKIFSFYDIRIVFVSAIIIFELGSVICV